MTERTNPPQCTCRLPSWYPDMVPGVVSVDDCPVHGEPATPSAKDDRLYGPWTDPSPEDMAIAKVMVDRWLGTGANEELLVCRALEYARSLRMGHPYPEFFDDEALCAECSAKWLRWFERGSCTPDPVGSGVTPCARGTVDCPVAHAPEHVSPNYTSEPESIIAAPGVIPGYRPSEGLPDDVIAFLWDVANRPLTATVQEARRLCDKYRVLPTADVKEKP